mmetsp:Transcript_32476/g.41716  ORF Transcript_32476/g.41716 Transcript_32476/m.41716 type:complete len:1190 (-) Transcript_32476:330-3899(-)
MSDKKLNANAKTFSFNPNVTAWSPGNSFDPTKMSTGTVVSKTPTPTPAPAPVPEVPKPTPTPPVQQVAPASTSASEPITKEVVKDAGPKPVQPPAAVWPKSNKTTPAPKTTESTPKVVTESTPTPVAPEPKTEPTPTAPKETVKEVPTSVKPATQTPSANIEVTFGEFDDKKKPTPQTTPAAESSTQPPQPTAAPVPTPVVPAKAPMVNWRAAAMSAPAPPAQGQKSFAPNAASTAPPRPIQQKQGNGANKDKDNKDGASSKKDKRNKNKKDKGKGGSSNSQTKAQDNKQGGKQQASNSKQAAAAAAPVKQPEPAPVKQSAPAPVAAKQPEEPAPAPTPVVKTSPPVVEAAPQPAPSTSAAPINFAAAASKPPVTETKPIPVTVKKKEVAKSPPSAPSAPAETKVQPPPLEITPAAPTPATTSEPVVATNNPPAPVRKPVQPEENWRSGRSLRPGGSRPEGGDPLRPNGSNNDGNGGMKASPSNADSGGRWGKVALPPSATEDPSASWASKPTSFTLFSLLEYKESNHLPPSSLNLELPIIHLYVNKIAEEETRRAASENGNNKGGRGPLRPKGPPKQYEKPKWAAGTKEGEGAEVMRKALFILNKLTVEKFSRLSDEFLNVGFTSIALLEGAIDIIVDKAQMEHHFGAMYADLCLKLAKSPLSQLGEEDKGKQFKKSLLQRCQQEFEKDQKEILAGLNELEDNEDRDMQILTVRKRYLGHMKFVGHLFRVQLLSDKIMHICVKELFGDSEDPDEEKIQCLCTLMTTIGGQLEASAVGKAEKAKLMKKYLKDISALSTNSKISSRIRFMCKDLLEMRANGWTSRREEESAKTIAQIHQEADREQNKNQRGGGGGGGNSSPRANQGGGNNSSPRANNRASPRANQEVGDSEWKTSTKPSRGGNNANANKRNNNTPTNGNVSSSQPRGERAAMGGGFGAFAEKEKRDKQEKKDRKERKEKEKEAKRSKEALSSESTSTPTAAAAEVVNEIVFKMTPEQYSNSCKTEFEQHINGGSLDEVIESMKEFGTPVPTTHISAMISVVLNHLFSNLANDKAVTTGGNLFLELVKQNMLEVSGLEAGFTKFLENFEDYVCDAPKSMEWFPQIIALMINAEILSLKIFAEAEGSIKEGWKLEEFFGFSTTFLVRTLSVLQIENKKSSSEYLKEAGLDIRSLAEDDVALDKLLVEYKVTL